MPLRRYFTKHLPCHKNKSIEIMNRRRRVRGSTDEDAHRACGALHSSTMSVPTRQAVSPLRAELVEAHLDLIRPSTSSGRTGFTRQARRVDKRRATRHPASHLPALHHLVSIDPGSLVSQRQRDRIQRRSDGSGRLRERKNHVSIPCFAFCFVFNFTKDAAPLYAHRASSALRFQHHRRAENGGTAAR